MPVVSDTEEDERFPNPVWVRQRATRRYAAQQTGDPDPRGYINAEVKPSVRVAGTRPGHRVLITPGTLRPSEVEQRDAREEETDSESVSRQAGSLGRDQHSSTEVRARDRDQRPEDIGKRTHDLSTRMIGRSGIAVEVVVHTDSYTVGYLYLLDSWRDSVRP